MPTPVRASSKARDSSGDGGRESGSFADLQAGVQVAEVDVDDDTGNVEEIELIGAGADD